MPTAVFCDPDKFSRSAEEPIAVFAVVPELLYNVLSPIATLPQTPPSLPAKYPNERFVLAPELNLPTLSLFTLNTKGLSSVVPIKFVLASVPLFPLVDHKVLVLIFPAIDAHAEPL